MAHRQPDRERGLQHRPVFVLCPPRSCSTVVTVLLGGHPGLFAVPELRLFRADRIGGILADRLRLAGLLRALAQVHDGDQSEASVAAAYDWLTERADWPGVAVLDHLQELVAPLTLVEKSPENTSRDVYLRRFARAYPQARYLHLVRHPQASVTSLLNYWQPPREWRLPRTMQHQFGCSFWLFQHRRIERFLRDSPAERSRRVVCRVCSGRSARSAAGADGVAGGVDRGCVDRADAQNADLGVCLTRTGVGGRRRGRRVLCQPAVARVADARRSGSADGLADRSVDPAGLHGGSHPVWLHGHPA